MSLPKTTDSAVSVLFSGLELEEGYTPADTRMLRKANHSLAAESNDLQTALADLLRQVDEFCEREGESDFETDRAREALKRAGYWF